VAELKVKLEAVRQILYKEKDIADIAAAALAKGPFELEFQCRAVADEGTVMFSELNAVKTDLKHMEATLNERLDRNADQEEVRVHIPPLA